eukprot:CAMPEP_0202457192 /NCGR_PEP_ID=MMETSP1360-20130828/14263_1 /ASSEMBLY_ACC=CAM_ASM_000848 /TAXON_ID=515479 /ORGANISM="Licmophora paradoxa, Strain CCMP2313" /LENGTH=48 /DNA_ID= /DNA_START= /DNA_END= /DNA_ORIENTATION=
MAWEGTDAKEVLENARRRAEEEDDDDGVEGNGANRPQMAPYVLPRKNW